MNESAIISAEPLGFPWKTQDPFLFCAHHLDLYPEGNSDLTPNASLDDRVLGNDFTIKDGWRMYHGNKVPGFPYHPHKGFETITVAKQGFIDHADSLGGHGRFGTGDVQWMTAGKGILHSEMFPMVKQDNDNTLEIFQLWINLPKRSKLAEPFYKMHWSEDRKLITEIDNNSNQITIDLITGKYKTIAIRNSNAPESWSADMSNDVVVAMVCIKKGAIWTMPDSKADINRSLFFYSGNKLEINGTVINNNHAINLNSQIDTSVQAIDDDCYLLWIQGKPINEPVAQHGPFVMNTREEIVDAFNEYKQTKFGGWPWKEDGPTHGTEQKRFAVYPDKTKEYR